jgi:hypothetical protein
LLKMSASLFHSSSYEDASLELEIWNNWAAVLSVLCSLYHACITNRPSCQECKTIDPPTLLVEITKDMVSLRLPVAVSALTPYIELATLTLEV